MSLKSRFRGPLKKNIELCAKINVFGKISKMNNISLKSSFCLLFAGHLFETPYCINVSLVRSCSVSINSCKSESVKLSQEAILKVTKRSKQLYWLGKCYVKHQEK